MEVGPAADLVVADLLLILAGPIVRRVEPRLVSVWMALSQPRALQLNVFEGREQTGTCKFVFLGAPKIRGATNTLGIGVNLHVGVVVAEAGEPPAQPLNPGINYSYNVLFAPFVESAGQGANRLLPKPQMLEPAAPATVPSRILSYKQEVAGSSPPPPAR